MGACMQFKLRIMIHDRGARASRARLKPWPAPCRPPWARSRARPGSDFRIDIVIAIAIAVPSTVGDVMATAGFDFSILKYKSKLLNSAKMWLALSTSPCSKSANLCAQSI